MTSVLNGQGTYTEGARLNKMQKGCCETMSQPQIQMQMQGQKACNQCPLTPAAQPPITPSEGSRIATLGMSCGVSMGGVSQQRARELLATSKLRRNPVSEGVRIDQLIQDTAACSPPPLFYSPIVQTICPRLPPPPAPPARACPLTKNQKF